MSSNVRESFNSLSGGEMYSIKWTNSQTLTMNTVLPVNENEFLFIEFGKETYYTQIQTFTEEVQPKEDIVEYLEYLMESGEASVQFMGHVNKESTYRNILTQIDTEPELDWRKNKMVAISKAVHGYLEKVLKSYNVLQDILELPMKSGDVMLTIDSKGCSENRERLTQVDENFYVMLPTKKREISTQFDEEKMTKEELVEYLFDLVTEERMAILWESVFCPKRSKKIITLSEKEITLTGLS